MSRRKAAALRLTGFLHTKEYTMTQTQEPYSPCREQFAFYTGSPSPCFTPILAGITNPDPSYEIRRSCGDCYVFEYVICGMGHMHYREQQFLLEAGDAYILCPGEYQHYYSDKQNPWKKVWFNVNGSLVRHLLTDYGLDSVSKISAFQNPAHLYAIFSAIEKEPVHCTQELALHLHRHIQALSIHLESHAAVPAQAAAMKDYIEHNLTLPIGIDDIAAHVHLSRSRAMHLFRDVYHVTPYSYYLSQRLELAQTLLKRTHLSVQEIADRLGFSDYHHFSGFFKKNCGLSPTQYRAL